MVLDDGYAYDRHIYASLTEIARDITGTHWSGPQFFGLRPSDKKSTDDIATRKNAGALPMMPNRQTLRRSTMTHKPEKFFRCAIYTRKSTEHGLELEFNSLDAQKDSCEAYIKSQTLFSRAGS
jgi:hypothetical protein